MCTLTTLRVLSLHSSSLLAPARFRASAVVARTVARSFDALYAASGGRRSRRSILLRTLLLQVFYSVRSERLLVKQIDYNLLFRWFVGLGMDDAVWNHAVFSKNRDRLL